MNFDFAALSRGTKIVLAAGLLLFIDTFLDWQQVSIGPLSVGADAWHGIGWLAGLLVIALLLWEALRLSRPAIAAELPVPAPLVSLALAAGTALFTIIKFFEASLARHWPAWVGLILAVAIAIGGWLRFSEGPKAVPSATPTTPT